jgi:hypothetical protein
VKLWKSLAEKHGVQTPHHRDIEERVFQTLPHLYAKLEEGKKLLAPSRFHEMRYEDLVRDPIGQMHAIYNRLELDGFEQMRPRLFEFLARNANYETNKFQLSTTNRDAITERWGDVIRRYGYPIEGADELIGPSAPRLPDFDEPAILPFPALEPAVDAETDQPTVPVQVRPAARRALG